MDTNHSYLSLCLTPSRSNDRDNHNRSDDSAATEAMFTLDLQDTEPQPSQRGHPSPSSPADDDDQGTSRMAGRFLSSRFTQNWFFQNTDNKEEEEAQQTATATAKQMKAKEFHVWSPQTM